MAQSSDAAAGIGTVTGIVADQINGLPVAGATVTLFEGDTQINQTTTDNGGSFTFTSVRPGIYQLVITAAGYGLARTSDIAVVPGETVKASTILSKTNAANGLKTIATVRGTGNALTQTTTITRSLDPAILQNENFLRAGDALRTLPGVNLSGLSSSAGDDLTIDVRGLGSSEVQTLLDGHPVGPQGVYGFNAGGGVFPGAFNFADSPFFALDKVQVTFGSGAGGLYGVDKTGGSIDMETLNPTAKPQFALMQGIGNQGKSQTAVRYTGTTGRFGFVAVGSVQGEYGEFAPQQIAQTGRPNNNANLNNGGACTASNDLTTCNLQLNTYQVSQNTNIRSALLKAEYQLSSNTTATGTWFGSGQWADSTGNGDNDNIPFDTRLAQIQNNSTPNCALPTDPAGTTSGYTVITDSNPNACYSAAQWAAASSGPLGGGAGRARGTSTFDYHARLRSVAGHSTYTADTFFNHYKFFKTSQDAAGLDPTGTFFSGNVFSQFLNTTGLLLSDDIAGTKGELGFGYFTDSQLATRLNFNNTPDGFTYATPAQLNYNSGFVRGDLELNSMFSIFANGWLKHSSVTNQTNFDPRVSFVFRPSSHRDVLRFTYGRTSGDPAAELKASGPPQLTGNASSLTNPNCPGPNSSGINTIASGGNPNLNPEEATDFELGYAHSFGGDSSVQLNLYTTNVTNQLFSASESLAQFGSSFLDPNVLAQFATKIAGPCGLPALVTNPSLAIPLLGVSTTFNAEQGQFRGVELSGRQRLNSRFYVDYAYDIQSAVENGIGPDILKSNPFLINGAQVQGIPVHNYTLGFDYSTPSGFEARLDAFHTGDNNASNRPAYTLMNGFVSQPLNSKLSVTLGATNLFNNAVQNYGYIGHQLFIPENQFFHDPNSIQEALNAGGEEFGVPPRAVLLQLTEKL